MPANKNPQTLRPTFQPDRVIAPHRTRRQWEYTVLSDEQPLKSTRLDVYGYEGWELVTVYVRLDAVFKREVMQ